MKIEVKRLNNDFFRFPKDEKLKSQWIKLIEAACCCSISLFSSSCVCSSHFSADCFKNHENCKLLNHDAIPTLFSRHTHNESQDSNFPPQKRRKIDDIKNLSEEEIDSMPIDELRFAMKQLVKSYDQIRLSHKRNYKKLYYQTHKPEPLNYDTLQSSPVSSNFDFIQNFFYISSCFYSSRKKKMIRSFSICYDKEKSQDNLMRKLKVLLDNYSLFRKLHIISLESLSETNFCPMNEQSENGQQ